MAYKGLPPRPAATAKDRKKLTAPKAGLLGAGTAPKANSKKKGK